MRIRIPRVKMVSALKSNEVLDFLEDLFYKDAMQNLYEIDKEESIGNKVSEYTLYLEAIYEHISLIIDVDCTYNSDREEFTYVSVDATIEPMDDIGHAFLIGLNSLAKFKFHSFKQRSNTLTFDYELNGKNLSPDKVAALLETARKNILKDLQLFRNYGKFIKGMLDAGKDILDIAKNSR